jgi:hypothetical protein
MNSNKKCTAAQLKKQKQSLVEGKSDISLTDILNSEKCQAILGGCREFRDRIYTPFMTMFTFIKQVLNPDKSCKKAVAGVVVEQLQQGNKVSSNTGPYCNARQRLPEEAVHALVKEVGAAPLKHAPAQWKPYGRELTVLDGSTLKMPDTAENQEAFPQHKGQKEGLGFPILRFVVILSMTMGTVLDYAVGQYKGKGTGEQSLFRMISDCIKEKDILVGDAYFPSFFLMADILQRRADGIFQGQSQRHYDFRKGERLGKNDHIVEWKKPNRPDWIDPEAYASIPDKIRIREFKVAGKVYITTFLSTKKKYHKKELAAIYERRWEVEINLKSIKDIMGMDMLSCKTPDMVRKEIGTHFLAYNCIRILMAEACEKHNTLPWKISFKGTVQLLNEFMPHFLNSSKSQNKLLYANLLELIVKNKVGNRPGRVEPRAVKRRPKSFPRLQRPRIVEQKRLMKKIEKRILKNAAA